MLRLTLALLLAIVTCTTAFAQPPKQDDKGGQPPVDKKIGKGPRDATPGEVDIHFLNGSTVRMVIVSDKVEIATEYGKLMVPVKDIRAVEFGLHFPEGVETKIDDAIKGLGKSDYREREKAATALIDLGPYSYPAILEASRSKDAEVSQRAKELVKKLQSTHPKKDLKTTTEDKVMTKSFTIVGKILTPTMKAKTEYFGDVELTLTKMRTLRSVAGSGLEMEVALDASKYSSAGQWMDTNYHVDNRSTIQITAKGFIDVWPQQNGQYLSNPNGFQATQRGGPLAGQFVGNRKVGAINQNAHCGMLLGKIGEDGEVFIIGERYEFTPDVEGKLYLHVGPSQWNVPSAGTFEVRMSRKD